MEKSPTYNWILVPHDGSADASLALEFAQFIPSRHLRLLKVEPNFQVIAPGPLSNFRPDWREIRTEQVQEELAAVVKAAAPADRNVDLAVRYGDPATEIISDPDADLIVMTTQGRGAAGRVVFGSTADRVVRHGSTPTLLIRGGQAGHEAVPPTRVLVSLDGSERSEYAIPEAIRLARVLGLPLHFIRVVDTDSVLRNISIEPALDSRNFQTDAAFREARDNEQKACADYLAAHAEKARAQGLTTTTHIRTGTPAFELLDELRPDDILVMTTQGRSGIRRWLIGSVAEKLIREADAPILIVHAAPDQPQANEATEESV